MIEHVGWLKALGSLFRALFSRATHFIGRRKPKLYVHFQPIVRIWSIAKQPTGEEYMQVVFRAKVNHDDPVHELVILDAYPVGTTTQVGTFQAFAIEPNTIVDEQIAVIVVPVIGKKGQPWTGKMILVDQFKRKYRTEKMTFKWAGPL